MLLAYCGGCATVRVNAILAQPIPRPTDTTLRLGQQGNRAGVEVRGDERHHADHRETAAPAPTTRTVE